MTPPNDPASSRGDSTGQTSWEAAGSIRDRLSHPSGANAPDGSDTRSSGLTSDDFVQSDSRSATATTGHGAEQQVAHQGPAAGFEITPRPTNHVDTDPRSMRKQEAKVAGLFLLSVAGVVGFFAVYWGGDWKYSLTDPHWRYATPLLGVAMAVALFGLGAGAVVWAKTLMTDEEAVQQRHPLASTQEEREKTVAVLKDGFAATSLGRRPLLAGTLGLSSLTLGLLPVPLLFSLGPYAHKERALRHTSWAKGVRLVRQNGTPVKLGDLPVGGVETVFPDVPDGTKAADSGTLLIRMLPEQLHLPKDQESFAVDGHVAYSVVCTHAGCPVKLYEQQTHHLLCPCHQSTFASDRGAKVIFGPAPRPLPQLALAVDDEGYFVAQGDYPEPIGPGYWERT